MDDLRRHRLRWREYRTHSGRRPVREYLADLPAGDRVEVLAAMAQVRSAGLREARHLGDDVWEVRADGDRVTYRVLFAVEGRTGQVLLALVAFSKKTNKTPPQEIRLARQRLADWRRRGASERSDG